MDLSPLPPTLRLGSMTDSDAQKALERIERELNSKAAPTKKESRLVQVNRNQPYLDVVLMGVVAMLGIAFLLPLAKNLEDKDIDSISAGALGSAIALAIGYGIGRAKR